ncbi:MAG: TIGR00730 family Rossman fold protein [Casimicrobiaceae bacterium]|nr:TIGR00730 family Rossman fold protein [Casimicrobiaceae bacterium]MCX8098585.1 TIGR00730 family Rossman fold protein [Casimicrobiaceae bacterium]MDW8312684.1 TIGR00730 family Rossman fold protein [Burkholderiales bacterium]
MVNRVLRIAVFCGANSGADPAFRKAAEQTAHLLARRGIGIVYGGGAVGLMGALAEAALRAGGEVIGVIPEALKVRELEHKGLTALHTVPDMHSRKAMMHALADAVIALPGGYGTLDELFEALTWSQLGLARKPCGLLNVGGYYDPLLEWLDRAVTMKLLSPEHRNLLVVDSDAERLVEALGGAGSP